MRRSYTRFRGCWPVLRRGNGAWADFTDRVAAWSLAGMTLLCLAGLARNVLQASTGLTVLGAMVYACALGLVCTRFDRPRQVVPPARIAAHILCLSVVCFVAVLQARHGMDRLARMGGVAAEVTVMAAALAAGLPRLRRQFRNTLSAPSVFNNGEKS